MAASATFALKAGVWFRRARLLIVSPDSRVNLARRQAETPLIPLFRFLRPALLNAFFSTPAEGIDNSEQLALALATRSRYLRDYLGEELVRQHRERAEGPLYGLFEIFRDQVFHELTLKDFADAFAQMLAYGLFLARLNSDSEPITLNNAREYVPGSFR